MDCNSVTFEELDLLEQDLRRQLSELEDVRFAMMHDPAFGFATLTAPRGVPSPEMIEVNAHRRVMADSVS